MQKLVEGEFLWPVSGFPSKAYLTLEDDELNFSKESILEEYLDSINSTWKKKISCFVFGVAFDLVCFLSVTYRLFYLKGHHHF